MHRWKLPIDPSPSSPQEETEKIEREVTVPTRLPPVFRRWNTQLEIKSSEAETELTPIPAETKTAPQPLETQKHSVKWEAPKTPEWPGGTYAEGKVDEVAFMLPTGKVQLVPLPPRPPAAEGYENVDLPAQPCCEVSDLTRQRLTFFRKTVLGVPDIDTSGNCKATTKNVAVAGGQLGLAGYAGYLNYIAWASGGWLLGLCCGCAACLGTSKTTGSIIKVAAFADHQEARQEELESKNLAMQIKIKKLEEKLDATLKKLEQNLTATRTSVTELETKVVPRIVDDIDLVAAKVHTNRLFFEPVWRKWKSESDMMLRKIPRTQSDTAIKKKADLAENKDAPLQRSMGLGKT